jgi:hypothetical protein
VERPNSTFLDQAYRYTSCKSEYTLEGHKKFDFATRVSAETVGYYFKAVALGLFVWVFLWLAVKYRLVAFPFLGIGY